MQYTPYMQYMDSELIDTVAASESPTAMEVELIDRLQRAQDKIEDLENELAEKDGFVKPVDDVRMHSHIDEEAA